MFDERCEMTIDLMLQYGTVLEFLVQQLQIEIEGPHYSVGLGVLCLPCTRNEHGKH
jgi:hypothetical protein